MPEQCPNCFHYYADAKFCPECGQKTHLHRLSLHDLWHDGVHYFTHADKGILGLLRDLVIKNGTVAKEYVGGRRKAYFPPLNFFLVIATLFVIIATAATRAPNEKVALRAQAQLSKIKDPAAKERVRQIYIRSGKVEGFMGRYANIIAMVAAPLIAFIYWLFYIRGRYNYAEHLVACMYMVGFFNLLYVVLFVPAGLLVKKVEPESRIVLTVFIICQILYNALFYYRFIDRRSASAAWKSFGISALILVLWVFGISLLIWQYITHAFWGLAT